MKKSFKEKQGVIYNPYIGFTSFNHFRGERLYSDCIVGKQDLAGCETENYEFYPVPEGIEENGREQGYYTDTTVAYIRSLMGSKKGLSLFAKSGEMLGKGLSIECLPNKQKKKQVSGASTFRHKNFGYIIQDRTINKGAIL